MCLFKGIGLGGGRHRWLRVLACVLGAGGTLEAPDVWWFWMFLVSSCLFLWLSLLVEMFHLSDHTRL